MQQPNRSTMQEITRGTKAAVRKLLEYAVAEGQVWPGFQPIVDIKSGKVSGFEVLARWSDPDDGDISPDVFIQSLERLGLIDLLSNALMSSACSQAASWPGHFFLAFNISPLQLLCEKLPSQIADIARNTGFPIDRIQIEITEGSLVDDADGAYAILGELEGMGVRIAIDDFGTGYSNLARLESFPFRKLKIDRRFIRLIDQEPAKRRIAAAIIGLAQSLSMHVVAEGIETKEEEAVLREFGCDLGQGWLYAKALRAHEAQTFLDTIGDENVRHTPFDISPFQRMHQLATLYKNAPLGLSFVDMNFRHVSANDRFASMHGMSAAELEGKTVHEVMDAETAKIAERLLISSRETGASMQHQYFLSGRHILVFNTCIFDSDSDPMGYSVIAIDNSEQVRALQALVEREEHYRHITTLNPDIEWSATAGGMFDYVSPGVDDLPGETMRQRIDRWFEKIHPEDLPCVQQRWFEWIKCGDLYEADFRVRTTDGSYRWVRSSALAAKGPDGKIRKWYGITKMLDEEGALALATESSRKSPLVSL
ncbi:EAL domain-containing protein (plasmid) [Rhizobium sp. NIBRBAC000502774]|nr:EAL domain-containing protein [Rhizobium sp. NIBRBAC000502774]